MDALHTVSETATFLAKCKAEGVTDAERAEIVDALMRNPEAGDVIRETGGARKVRFAGRGQGKSGGYRVITAFIGWHAPVYLLALYGKGQKADLGAEEKKAIKKLIGTLKKLKEPKP